MQQLTLDLTQTLTEGEVKNRILALWNELNYNEYARVNSVKKPSNLGVASGSLDGCHDVGKLLFYILHLEGKKK